MANPSRLDEQEQNKLCKLLHHLRTNRLDNVPHGLLWKPGLDTQPRLGLVADYDITCQVFLRQFSLITFIRALFVLMTGLASLLTALFILPEGNWTSVWVMILALWESPPDPFASIPWLGILFQQILMPMGWLLALGVIAGFALFLRGRLSCTWDALILDLNYLYCTMANGREQVRWQDVLAVSPARKCWIRVRLENQVMLFVRVPEDDRECLVQTIGQLILHHQDLHGVFPDDDT